MWFCAASTSIVYTLCLCTAISQNTKNDKVPLLEDTAEPHPNPLTVGTSNKVRNWILITIFRSTV